MTAADALCVLEEHQLVAMIAMKDLHGEWSSHIECANPYGGGALAPHRRWHNALDLSIHVALNHLTSYRYDRLVGLSPQLVRLRPAPHCRTPILSYSLRIAPRPHFVNWQQDPQSNYLARVTFPEKVREFRLEVDLVAEMAVYNPFDFFLEPQAETFPFTYEDWQLQELQPYLRREPLTPTFARYLAATPTTAARTVDFLVALNQQLQRDIKYVIRLDPGRADDRADA